jgi:hypothetical protein
LPSVFTVFAAMLATQSLIRKLRHLFSLHRRLPDSTAWPSMKTIKKATRLQKCITFLRIVANIFAIISLPWSIYDGFKGDNGRSGNNGSVYLAALAVTIAVISVLMFFYMEFGVRYNFDPAIGGVICAPFHDLLMELYRTFHAPALGLEEAGKEERESWDLTARKFLREHRFDTVMAADRFGTVLAFIQGGNVPNAGRTNKVRRFEK